MKPARVADNHGLGAHTICQAVGGGPSPASARIGRPLETTLGAAVDAYQGDFHC